MCHCENRKLDRSGNSIKEGWDLASGPLLQQHADMTVPCWYSTEYVHQKPD